MPDKPVHKCICGDVTFATLKSAGIGSLEDAQKRFNAGANCRLCVPYIQKMIETGETEFEILPEGSE